MSQFSSDAERPDYYQCLGLTPSATLQAIRQAHRDLSKRYHPDTTRLPVEQARLRFVQLQEAYRVLSDPAARLRYDQRQGYSRLYQRQTELRSPVPPRAIPKPSSSDYLEPGERPLSSGEIFSLFLFAVTILGCLGLAIVLALARGEPLA